MAFSSPPERRGVPGEPASAGSARYKAARVPPPDKSTPWREDTTSPSLTRGGVAEWFKAAVLKTAEPQGSGGSNPSSSARIRPRSEIGLERTVPDAPARLL